MSHLGEDDLLLYADKQLPVEQAENCGKHLEECAGCRERLAVVQKLLGALAEPSAAAKHDDGLFLQRTMAALDAPAARTRAAGWQGLLVAAALLIVAVPAVLLYRAPSRERE